MNTLPQPWMAWPLRRFAKGVGHCAIGICVRERVRTKNKVAVLLMEAGVSYNKRRLHKIGYFRELLATNPDINDGLRFLLWLCHETAVRLGKTESALVRSLQRDSMLRERIERLMSIPAVGPVTALTGGVQKKGAS